MKIFYADQYVLPLPTGHRFPITKYQLLRERVASANLVAPADLVVPPAATDTEILRAHDFDYLHRMQAGLMTEKEIRRIGLPWTPQLVERSRRSSGATIAAARAALESGYGVNLAGGTHHAFSDHGEGYCVFNDSAIAVRTLAAEGLIQRAVIIDLDVHQGNGTAAILRHDEQFFTFSIHGEKNYPFHKEHSDLDVELPDGTTDDRYLETLRRHLPYVLAVARADLAIFLAGADAFEGDTLGRLKLTKAGLAARDAIVFEQCHAIGLPLAITMAGGYAKPIEDSVDIQFNTVRAAVAAAQR